MYYLFCLAKQKTVASKNYASHHVSAWCPIQPCFLTAYTYHHQAAEEPSVGENATGLEGRPSFDPKLHPKSNADSTCRKSVISNQSLEVKIGWSCKISQKKSSSWLYLLVWFASYGKLLTIYSWVVSASLKRAQQ